MRHEFPARIREILAKRVNYRCSNPNCRQPTSGPHEAPDRAVNVGVAAHITAAGPGGPRYDPSLSFELRTGNDNAIWLCQNCAKLVDSDAERYTVGKLRHWKSLAEDLALWELEGRATPDPFAVGAPASYAPIPTLYGLTYDEARQRLLDAGWQPYMHHWSYGSSPNIAGGGQVFWEKGYHELTNCSGTGYNFCNFAFLDVLRNKMVVVTAGEEDIEFGSKAHVVRWFFERDDER